MTPSHVRYRAAPRPDLRRELSQKPPGASRTEARAKGGKPLADAPERLGVRGFFHPELELLARSPGLGEETLLGPFEREPLVVEEGLDARDEVEVAAAVETLAGGVLLRAQQLELRLPVPQHVGRDGGELLDLADPVVQLLGRCGGHAVWALIFCFSPLLGLNVSTFRAVISMDSPVCGLRPRRDALRRIRKWPKPTILTSSPRSKHRKMISKTDSTTDADWRFESPWAATALTRSFFVTVTLHPPRSSPAPRDEALVALRLERGARRPGGGEIGERPHAHAMERVAGGGGRRRRRRPRARA